MSASIHLRGRSLDSNGHLMTPIDTVVRVPTSKSVANRVLICALLAEGESLIRGLPDGDDVEAMRDALAACQRLSEVPVARNNEGHDLEGGRVVGDAVRVIGGMAHGPLLPELVHCRLAGTTSRFLTAVAALQSTPVTITGDAPLRARPMSPLHDALRELGAVVSTTANDGHLPVSVSRGHVITRRLHVDASMSSQFISALMMIGPCIGDGLVLVVEGESVSQSYVEMTADCMRMFGADVQFVGNEIRIAATPYIPAEITIEPDFSSAAFPVAAVLMAGGRIRIPNLADATMQGDEAILDIAREMGAVVGRDGSDVVVVVDPGQQRQPIDRDLSNCSDLVPAIAIACASATGRSRLRSIGFIRAKESNRMSDLVHELTKFGCRITEDGDDLVIDGVSGMHSARIDPHHDHRLAMACALASVRGVDVVIEDGDVVSKSWPHYFDDMQIILQDPNHKN